MRATVDQVTGQTDHACDFMGDFVFIVAWNSIFASAPCAVKLFAQ